MQTGDTGFGWAEPVVQVVKPGGASVLYGNVIADRVQAFAADAAKGIARDHAIGTASGAIDGVPPLADHEWMRLQTRWIMVNCGVIDPDSIDHYIARGGYEQYMAATKLDRDELIKSSPV
jgi:hypothetical protein